MLTGTELEEALRSVAGNSLTQTLYRAIHLEALYGFHRVTPYPRPEPLYSLGAPAHGARYTPRGGPASLYLAEDPETALAEANQVNLTVRHLDPTLARIAPTVMLSVDVHLPSVLDITRPDVQAALAIDPDELLGPWRVPLLTGLPPTQELGDAVFRCGRFQAVLYPSARLPGHRCLVVFTDHLASPAYVEVHDPHGNVSQRIP